jgi:hypothetical protein
MKKLLPIVVAALVLIATQAFGATAYRYNDSVTTLRGDAVGGASVTVYLAGTTTKATIYLYGSTAVEKSNPTYTDGYGRYFFYAEPGLYDLTIAGSNVITYTVEDVRVFSDAGYTFNVEDYGAIPDDGIDDTAAVQAAENASGAAGGGAIEFGDGFYQIDTGVIVNADNTHFIGKGIGATTVGWDDGDGDGGDGANGEYIFTVMGADNVSFSGMSLTNGPSEALGATNNPNDGGIIYADNCVGVRLENCRLYEIGGTHGFAVKKCGNVSVDNCQFYMISYAGMMVLDTCYDIKVTRSTFDTVNESVVGQNRYLFATGADSLYSQDSTNLYFVKDLMVDGCTFKNNPVWEGIDTHGGDRIRFTNNFVTGCYIGINAICAVSGSDDYVLAPSMNDLLIDGNTIDADGIAQVWYGIVARGHTAAATAEPWNADNIKITNNTIRGHGGTSKAGYSHDNSGSITAYNLRNVEISGNHIDEFAQTGIMLYAKLSGTRIVDNTIYSAYADTAFHRYDDRVAGISVRSATEMTNVLIERNRLRDDAGNWDIGIYGWSGTDTAGVFIGANEYDDATSGWDGIFSTVSRTWFGTTYRSAGLGATPFLRFGATAPTDTAGQRGSLLWLDPTGGDTLKVYTGTPDWRWKALH